MKSLFCFLLRHPMAVVFAISFLLCGQVTAQRLMADSKLQLTLGDGTDVVLYRSGETNNWYYLPPPSSIRVAQREDGEEEFLFLKFTTEERADQGGVQGGLLHFLVVWGLTPEQSAELESLLKSKKGGSSRVSGPVDLFPQANKSFALTSATLLDQELTKTMVASGMAPVMEGGRAAIAARLDKNGAQLLEASLKKNRGATDFTVEFYYDFTTILAAAKVKYEYNLEIDHTQGDGMVYDLIKLELDNRPELIDQAMAKYKENMENTENSCGVADGLQNLMAGLQAIDQVAGNTSTSSSTGSDFEYGISESMMRKVYDSFVDSSLITLEWEQSMDDERVDAFRDAFFQMFLQDVAQPQLPEYLSIGGSSNSVNLAADSIKSQAQGGYRFQSCTELVTERKVNKRINMEKLELPLTRVYPMVYNLPGGFKTVPVNLNDPFFKHRDINFIVDVEAMDIFEKEVNYVTVNVRKRRSQGNDFADAITISPELMQEQGRLAQITYARGEDNNPDLYEYKTQWSLRGGELYPTDPNWTRGDWQAVTLKAPIKPRTVEFEADLAELAEAGVTRATLQLRYMKFGRETETNIPLTVSKGEPLVTARIFPDRDQSGYAYRFIMNHKEEGKLATEWEAKINDDYVYATVPEELRAKDLTWLKKAKAAANVILQPGEGGAVKPGDMILEKFRGILDVLIEDEVE